MLSFNPNSKLNKIGGNKGSDGGSNFGSLHQPGVDVQKSLSFRANTFNNQEGVPEENEDRDD